MGQSVERGLSFEVLQNRKGELSRLIGEAKRNGQSADALIEEMKEVTAQIKAYASDKKSHHKEVDASRQSNTVPEAASDALPQLFSASTTACSAEKLITRLARDEDAQAWDQFVERQPGSSPYHLWAIRRIVQNAFGHALCYLVAVNASGEVVGVLPAVEINSRLFGHQMVTLPFFNYGGPLALNRQIEASLIQALIDEAARRGCEHVEVRSVISRSEHLEKQNKVSMILSLPGSVDALWKQIGSKVRAQIKKAQREALVCKIGREELLDDFYRVFAVNMRDLGTPVYGISFFRNIFSNFAESAANVVVVYHDKQPVSASILIGHKDMMEVPWASTLRAANALNANMFLYWNMLSHAQTSGYQYFDFGRSSKDAGTYKFKKQWGTREVPLYWQYWLRDSDELPELNPDNPKFKLLIAIWQRLPVWFTKLIGPYVVKNIP